MLVSSWVGESNIVLVAVQDSGTGLDSDSLNHIFEAFHTTKPNGAGIRLAISRSIIMAHGGQLWATNNTPLSLVRGNLEKHRILVEAEPNARLPVSGDRVQLQQVLLNLITNAIDSMAAKDEPRVLCVKSDVQTGGGVKVSVADTGTGIGSQNIDRIFNPLFTTKSDGMGMGLSICRSIIEAHDGRIWVAPNKPQGAVFQFILPAGGASAGASPREQPDDRLA